MLISRGATTMDNHLPERAVFESIEVERTVDASDLQCPLPLLKAKQGLNQLSSGQRLKVIATDRGSVRDFHAFIELSQHTMVAFQETETHYYYILEKG